MLAGRFGVVIAIFSALLAAPAINAHAGGDAAGVWLTQASDAKVRVSKCGGGLCGVVVWLREPNNPATASRNSTTRIRTPLWRSAR